MEKGLWQNSSSPLSSPISYMGKSTIQQNSYRSLSMWPGQNAPSLLRSTPAVFWAVGSFPAVRPTKHPGVRPRAFTTSSFMGWTNLAMPPTISPFSS